MKIDEAIERLETAREGWPISESELYYEALELGLEALKRVRQEREGTFAVLLPGESE